MAPASNDELLQHIADQQKQIADLATQLNAHAELSNTLLELFQIQSSHIEGLGATQQLFSELVMAASPAIKELVAGSTSQALQRPDTIKNQVLLDQIRALNKAASLPSRTTPDGRRAHFQVIPGDKPESET